MKLPKTLKRLCPYCKKHTEHTRYQSKKRTSGSAHPMSYGSKKRARKRGQARGQGNLGRYSKKAISKFKMTGAKTSKKTDFRFKCNVCGKSHVQKTGFRARKLEIK